MYDNNEYAEIWHNFVYGTKPFTREAQPQPPAGRLPGQGASNDEDILLVLLIYNSMPPNDRQFKDHALKADYEHLGSLLPLLCSLECQNEELKRDC